MSHNNNNQWVSNSENSKCVNLLLVMKHIRLGIRESVSEDYKIKSNGKTKKNHKILLIQP